MRAEWREVVWLLVAGLVLTWVSGCAPRISTEEEIKAVAAVVPEENYPLGPEDALEISVWKEPELTKQMVVRPDGKISYPLIGEVQATGKTVKELQAEISKRLEKYVVDAQVTVILLKPQQYKVYVVGKVAKPGEFLVGRPTNVMQALAMAGGVTPFASPSNIVIIRKTEGKDLVFPFNYNAVARGDSLEQNRTLIPGDVVVVP